MPFPPSIFHFLTPQTYVPDFVDFVFIFRAPIQFTRFVVWKKKCLFGAKFWLILTVYVESWHQYVARQLSMICFTIRHNLKHCKHHAIKISCTMQKKKSLQNFLASLSTFECNKIILGLIDIPICPVTKLHGISLVIVLRYASRSFLLLRGYRIQRAFFLSCCCCWVFLAALAAYGSSQARNQIQASAVQMHQCQILNPLHQARD